MGYYILHIKYISKRRTHMKKKIVTLMLATVLTASALTACGSSSDSSASFSASASSASVEFSDSSTETTSSSVIADVSAISDSTATENISEESVSASSESSENSVAFTPIGDSLAIDFDLNGPLEFPDDATGKWRKVTFAKGEVEFQYYTFCKKILQICAGKVLFTQECKLKSTK